eukprot:10911-Heterococcus_DN1.PRE.1
MLDIATVQAVDARSTLHKLAVRSMQLTDDTCPVYLDATPTAPIMMDDPPTVAEDNGVDTGVDADGGYSQDKRALRGASTSDKTSGDTADIADTSSLTSGGSPLITLSSLPRAYWASLFHLELVKARNRPIEPPKKPEAAPFFLPTQHRGGQRLCTVSYLAIHYLTQRA